VNFFGRTFQKSHVILIGLCIVSLSLRLWLIDKQWVNVDEGAHLMDAALALEGHIPEVDFSSRQPLYVYVLAGFVKLFGADYIAGRLYGITFSLLTGIIVFLLAKALFDEKVAMLSAAMYFMLPLELFGSTLVKTESLAIFLTSLSMYSVVRFLQCAQRPWLVAAGAIAAMAYYVRESSLVIPVAVLTFLFVLHPGRVSKVVHNFGLFLAGYLAVVLTVMAFYSQYVSPDRFLTMSPFGFLFFSLARLVDLPVASVTPVNGEPLVHGVYESLSLYSKFLTEAFILNSFLILGFGLSAVMLGYRMVAHKGEGDFTASLAPHILLHSWVLFLLLAYFYYLLTTSFYLDYAREFLPPLVIIFSAWLTYSIPALRAQGAIETFVVAMLLLAAILFVVQSVHRDIGLGYLSSMSIALFALASFARAFELPARRLCFLSIFVMLTAFILVSRDEPFKAYFSGIGPSLAMIVIIYGLTWILLERTARPPVRSYATFIALSLAMASFVVSVSYAGCLFDLVFEGQWSPKAVNKVATYLRSHTNDQDEVMSGGVIWEFQAVRKPFRMISHPLRFERGASEEERRAIEASSKLSPPRIIILDGYTERTYIRIVPELKSLVQARYHLVLEAGPGFAPVKVYELNDISPGQESGVQSAHSGKA